MKAPQLYLGSEGDYLSRWKRIVRIDALLRGGPAPSAPALARACGVSDKTIRRDLEALRSELGGPIEYNARRRGLCYTDPGFAIPATALSAGNLFGLMVAETALAQYEGAPLGDELRGTFRRMLAHLPRESRSRHADTARAIHFSGLPPTEVSRGVWSTFAQAIVAREQVELEYFTPAKQAVEARVVDPYLLVVRDREWFLVGRTQRSRHHALFYLPRVRRLRRTVRVAAERLLGAQGEKA